MSRTNTENALEHADYLADGAISMLISLEYRDTLQHRQNEDEPVETDDIENAESELTDRYRGLLRAIHEYRKRRERQKSGAQRPSPSEQYPSGIPCARCSGEVVEFTVPNDIWNAVIRVDGRERDDEYLCLECWFNALRARLATPPPSGQYPSDEEIIRQLHSLHMHRGNLRTAIEDGAQVDHLRHDTHALVMWACDWAAVRQRERDAQICEAERVDEETGAVEDIAYNMAIEHCADAIRSQDQSTREGE